MENGIHNQRQKFKETTEKWRKMRPKLAKGKPSIRPKDNEKKAKNGQRKYMERNATKAYERRFIMHNNIEKQGPSNA